MFAPCPEEIDAETNRMLGAKSKAVSSDPIMLSIRSKSVPNLTLVDMPGLTKVATSDQPESIVRDIEARYASISHTRRTRVKSFAFVVCFTSRVAPITTQ